MSINGSTALNTSSSRCFLYNAAADGSINWGNCCEELSIVPKPWWVVFVLSLPIEAVLAGADVRATKSMYEKKKSHTALIFVLYNLLSLSLLSYEYFASNTCDIRSVKGVFECYQGLIFMFYNSTAALATLTLWMLIIMRKYYMYIYWVARQVIWIESFWSRYDKALQANGVKTDDLFEAWKAVSKDTGLYWYNKLLMGITLMFGGLTHVVPLFFAYPYIMFLLVVAMVFSHSLRLAYINEQRMKESNNSSKQSRKNFKSVFLNISFFYPAGLLVSLVSMVLFVLKPFLLALDFLFRLSSTCFRSTSDLCTPCKPVEHHLESITEVVCRKDAATSYVAPETYFKKTKREEEVSMNDMQSTAFSTEETISTGEETNAQLQGKAEAPYNLSAAKNRLKLKQALKKEQAVIKLDYIEDLVADMEEIQKSNYELDEFLNANNEKMNDELNELYENLPEFEIDTESDDVEIHEAKESVAYPTCTVCCSLCCVCVKKCTSHCTDFCSWWYRWFCSCDLKNKKRKNTLQIKVFAHIKDILRNLAMYDPDGMLIMFASSTWFLCFTLSANYALLLYSGAPYEQIPIIDSNARSTALYFECTASNFKTFNAFGLVDFLGLALTGAGALLSFGEFIVSL